MLLIPELHAIFIFPPRTGSDSLCTELMQMHPNAFMLYRHGEATLVPPGYEGWRKVGFVRDPLRRLFSLFKYQAIIAEGQVSKILQHEIDRIKNQVEGRSFEDWVLNNKDLFLPRNEPVPVLYQSVHLPETRKSQHEYLRPDLGTVVLKFEDLPRHMAAWGLNPTKRHGRTPDIEMPEPSKKLKAHMKKYFAWDLAQGCADV